MDAAGMHDLLSRLACPLCGGDRSSSVLAVVEARPRGAPLVRAQCVRCHLFWSFPITWLDGLPEPEAEARPGRAPADPISDDELIDLHLLLRRHEGPLTGLLATS